MAEFVLEYAALRWSVVAAFIGASAIVVSRLVGVGGPTFDDAGRQPHSPAAVASDVSHHESDAAHLLMCMVMLTMLVFPAGADPQAMRGVLTAMTVVFAGLLACRIMEWRRAVPNDRIVALGYHVIAAAAMLYAMSGHSTDHGGGPTPGPALALAALFTVDALTVLIAAGTGRRHWLGHPTGPPADASGDRAFSWAPIPHLVMDLGTAYMLIAAVAR